MTRQALELRNVSVDRGGLRICTDVSITVPAGEITLLLGANGAGKSTLLDGVAGVTSLATGSIWLDGARLDRLPAHRRSRAGLSYIEQGPSVFTQLSVAQNIAVVDPSQRALERAVALFPRLAELADRRAGLLSGGEQQMLMIARALVQQPRYLLIDELSLGLGPQIVAELAGVLRALADAGTGILLVEQFVETALELGSVAHVLQRGRVVLRAACEDLREDPGALVLPYLHGTDLGD